MCNLDSQNFPLSTADWEFLFDCLCEGLGSAAFERIKPTNSQESFVRRPCQVVHGAGTEFRSSQVLVPDAYLKLAAHCNSTSSAEVRSLSSDLSQFSPVRCCADSNFDTRRSTASLCEVSIESTGSAAAGAGLLSLGTRSESESNISRRAALQARPVRYRLGTRARHLVHSFGAAICAYIVTRYLHLYQ